MLLSSGLCFLANELGSRLSGYHVLSHWYRFNLILSTHIWPPKHPSVVSACAMIGPGGVAFIYRSSRAWHPIYWQVHCVLGDVVWSELELLASLYNDRR